MKRILSMVVVFAMVISMIPSVFAASRPEVDFDELLKKYIVLETIDENLITIAAGADGSTYKWTPEKNGYLVLNLAVATEDVVVSYTVKHGETTVAAVDGAVALDVVAGTEVMIVFTEENKAAAEGTLTGKVLSENNTEAEPILVDFKWNQDYTEATATVTAEPGITYYGQYRIGDMALSINGGEAFIVENKGVMNPSTFKILNDGEAAAEYVLTLTYPVGTRMNPEVLEELDYYWGDVALEEGNGEGYYYTYTAPADGSVVLYFNNVTEGVTADIVVNNMNTSEQKSLLADGVDNYGLELTLTVSEGDQLMIQMVVTPDANWNIPAAEISWFGNFTYPVGSEQNPIQPEWQWDEAYTEATATVTVPAGETVYVAGNSGMYLSINGGEPTLMQSAGFGPFAPPPVFTLVNNGETAKDFALKIWFPEGAMMNPAKLVIGENTAQIGEGSEGYFYSWIAEKNGELTITMPEGNWSYTLNNLTTTVYGDQQYSDSDPVLNPCTINVKAGDEIQLIVNTYDPEKFWSAPAGSITFTAAFEELKYTPGNLDGNDVVDIDDAVYLALHTMMGDVYTVDQPVDFDGNGQVNIDDAIYLVLHTMMPDSYPLEK